MEQREYLIEVSCIEDQQPVRKYLREEGLSPSSASEEWIIEATGPDKRQFDAEYLAVRSTLSRSEMGLKIAGHEWNVQVIDEREAKTYPATK
ncbi:hypothetical protein KKP62_15870 [Rhodococcus sp. GOMB7]|jgi:hypothetical protein|uniref:hypothetical protein n=1 Tax=Rhodococcus sp. GOMB7 TaxID=2839033 RepID=UPI000FFB9647|nr:hypothetical protein [Rhodococcus sp. GOMB7]MBT9296448.1 hypothetical protein [Rhodococcus sp. GOMB7]